MSDDVIENVDVKPNAFEKKIVLPNAVDGVRGLIPLMEFGV